MPNITTNHAITYTNYTKAELTLEVKGEAPSALSFQYLTALQLCFWLKNGG